jgi:hypothetical protein
MVKNHVQSPKGWGFKKTVFRWFKSRHIIEFWFSPGMLVNRVLHIDEALNSYDGTSRVGGRAQAPDGNGAYIGL